MRKIYTAITMTLFALSSFANQGIGTEFISSSVQAQVSETLGTDFLEFTITDQVTSTINAVDHTVLVTMPAGTDLTALDADFTLSTGATAWVGGVQVSSTVDADFTTAVTYTVKNGSESQDWNVTVENEAAATVSVTFNVAMGECAGDKNVYISTGVFSWPDPGSEGSILMSDIDGDGTYTAVVEIPANTNDAYTYVVGEGWDGQDLTISECDEDHCLVTGTEDVTFNDVFKCTVNVTFTVTDDEGAIEGATVSFDGTDYTTDAEGKALISDVVAGNYNYTVSAAGHDNATGSITVAGADVDKAVNLTIVGISQNSLSSVSLYPNPVSNVLTIANLDGVSKVTVNNLLGQALVSKNVTDATMTINTAELKAGIYVVTLVSKNGTTRSERIVKE